MKDDSFLNRYTSLPFLFDMLVHERITLLSPTLWEDRNDSHYIERYKTEKQLKTVLALCFSRKRETFHHWKVFANGLSGVCIEFDKERFLASMRDVKGLRFDRVTYQYARTIEAKKPNLRRWPFLKRVVFKDEGEFRIIYEDANIEEKTKAIPFDLRCIQKISVSPWLPDTVTRTVIKVIKSIKGCARLTVIPSTLIENPRWMAAIENMPHGSCRDRSLTLDTAKRSGASSQRNS